MLNQKFIFRNKQRIFNSTKLNNPMTVTLYLGVTTLKFNPCAGNQNPRPTKYVGMIFSFHSSKISLPFLPSITAIPKKTKHHNY